MRRVVDPAAFDEASYGFWIREHVRFADLDFMGHVNNLAHAVYAESGRYAFLIHLGLVDHGSNRQTVLGHLEIDYKRELLYPNELRVGSCVTGIGRTSFTVQSGVFDSEGGATVVTAVSVRWDRETRKPIPLNDEELTALRGYLRVPITG